MNVNDAAAQTDRRILFNADARFALKREPGKPVTLEGYAMVWHTLSSDRGGYKVRLLPGSATFTAPALALWHHDYRHPIGNTDNGTLRIASDSYGLRVEIDLPDTTTGRDVAELVEKGYVRGMSFAMLSAPKARVIKGADGQEILEVEEFTFDEVTVTPIPAFVDTSIAVKQPADTPSKHTARTAQSLTLQRLRLDLINV